MIFKNQIYFLEEKLKENLTNNLSELDKKIEESKKKEKASTDLKKAAEFELSKLRIDFEEEKREHENLLASLKKRHSHKIEEMDRQIQQLFVTKAK